MTKLDTVPPTEGHFYRRRDGSVAGPAWQKHVDSIYSWRAGDVRYAANGSFCVHATSPFDLIEDLGAGTPQKRIEEKERIMRIKTGHSYRTAGGFTVGPLFRMTDEAHGNRGRWGSVDLIYENDGDLWEVDGICYDSQERFIAPAAHYALVEDLGFSAEGGSRMVGAQEADKLAQPLAGQRVPQDARRRAETDRIRAARYVFSAVRDAGEATRANSEELRGALGEAKARAAELNAEAEALSEATLAKMTKAELIATIAEQQARIDDIQAEIEELSDEVYGDQMPGAELCAALAEARKRTAGPERLADVGRPHEARDGFLETLRATQEHVIAETAMSFLETTLGVAEDAEQPDDVGSEADFPAAKPAVDATPDRMTKAKLLDTAKAAVADRGLNYSEPEDSFVRIAALWRTHLHNRYGAVSAGTIDAQDVAMMMVLMKIARLENAPDHMDSWIDIAGYAACGGEIAGSF